MIPPSSRSVLWVARVLLCLVSVGIGIPVGLSLGAEAWVGALLGLAFAGLLIQVEALSNGFSFRHFSKGTIGLLVGLACAWLLSSIHVFEISTIARFENSGEIATLFELALYVAFGFLGVALAVRAPREEFSLLIPYVRFLRESSLEQQLVIDRATLADGRLPALVESGFLGGEFIIDRSTVALIQQDAGSDQDLIREPAQAALDSMETLGKLKRSRLRIVESSREPGKGANSEAARVLNLANTLGVPVLTIDATVERLAVAQGEDVLSLAQLSLALRPELKPGDLLRVSLAREGKESHQALAYLGDGTMVVVNQAAAKIGSRVGVQITSLMPTAGGRMVFAELDPASAALDDSSVNAAK